MKIIIVNPHNYSPSHGLTLHRIFDSVEALQKLTLPFDPKRWYILSDAGVYLYLNHADAVPYTQATYPLALTPARAQLEQHYHATCAARAAAATINTYDQVMRALNAAAAELSAQLNQLHEQRATFAYYLRHLENAHSDAMAEAYTLFCQLYR